MHLGFSKNTIEQIQEYTRVCGVIKKKRDQGSLAALVVSSTPKWFCFRGLGRFLVYYDSEKKPGLYDKPEAVIFISDIKEVVDNYGGKKGHFLLKLEKEEVHLKCDENKDKNSWVEAINLLIELYQGKKIFDWDDDRKSHQDKIDVRVLHQIMDEHEEHFRDEILKKQDYSKVLKAKKLKNSLDLISRKIYDNHVVMGFVKKTSGQQIDVDVASDDRKRNVSLLDIAGLKNILPRNLMIWKDEFFIMITSKAFTVFGKEVDDHVISECDVPHWFELDTLYMFKYENDQDESEYFKKFNAKNFLMVEPANDSSFKGKYHFILETKEKVYFVGNETCKETNRWVAALKKAKLTAEENSRAKGSAGLRNIDNLVSLYKKKMDDELVDMVKQDMQQAMTKVTSNPESMTITDFLKVCKETQHAMNSTLDSIQASRPFYSELLKTYMKTFHLEWTEFVKQFWNSKIKEFDCLQILEFTALLHAQEKLVLEYGMSDPRYGHSYNELTATFCVRTFKNCLPMTMKVLDKMKSEFFIEKGVCYCNGPDDLFKILSEITNLYKMCPYKETITSMLSMCYKLIVGFQKEFRKVVTYSDDIELENFCALSNSNVKFISLCREFLESCQDASGVPLDVLQKAFQSNFVNKTFTEISNTSYFRLQDLVKDQVATAFLSIKDYREVVIQKFIEDLFMRLKPIFEKLYPSYSKKLWKFILDESINLFIQMLLICSLKFKAEEKGELLAKMATDKQNIRELFSVMLLPKDVDKSLEKIDLLTKALSDNLEEVPALIAKLKVAMGSQFNDNCTKCILRLRSDLTREEKVAIVEVIQSQKSLIEQAEKKEQRRVIKCNLLTEMRILNWLQRFRVRREQKLRLMADRDAARLQKQTLGIDEERKLEIEEELLGVRGYLDFYSCEAKSPQEFERIRVKPEKLDYNKYFFFFSDDVLQWKKKNTSSKSEGKVFITAIEEIGVEKDKYLCFRTKNNAYMIRCENTEDRKQWAQCLVFLKEQFKRDKSSQVFEKFVAVPETRCHEELFVSDPQDYDYEQVQIKPTRPKESSRKGFDIEGIQLGGEEVGSTRNSEGDSPGLTRQRSSEKLSDDSDEEDMNNSRQNKANKEPDGVQKEEITDIFKSLANIVSTQDTATGMFSKARNFFGL